MRPECRYFDVYIGINPYDEAREQGFESLPIGGGDDFGLPEVGDYYVTPGGTVMQKRAEDKGPYGPRLIVRPPELNEIQKVYGKEYKTVEDVWARVLPWCPECNKADREPGEFREALIGELFVTPGGHIQTCALLKPDKRLIVKPKLSEFERDFLRVYEHGFSPECLPEGFESTGEIRPARKGEYWLGFPWQAIQADQPETSFEWLILRKKEGRTEFEKAFQARYKEPFSEVPIPEGFESTNEVRRAQRGEFWLDFSGRAVEVQGILSTSGEWLILRKKEEKPEYELVFDYEEMRRASEGMIVPGPHEGLSQTIWVEGANHGTHTITGVVREKRKP